MSSYFKNTICTQGRRGDIVFLMALGSFIKTSPAEFVISSVKAAENGKGWLVRGYNISSETILLHLKPLCKFEKVMKVNLAEEPLTTLDAGDDESVTIDVHGHEIVRVLSIRI